MGAGLMSLFLPSTLRAFTEIPGAHPSAPLAYWLNLTGGDSTQAGQTVNESSALSASAVFSAIRLLAETSASLPLNVYRPAPGGGSEVADDEPEQWLLHTEPNEEMASDVMRTAMVAQMILRGNAYAEIERRGRVGETVGLHLIDATRVTTGRDDSGRIQHRVREQPRDDRYIPDVDMIHLKWFSVSGLVGMGLLDIARESIGMTLAAERFGSRFFGNSATPTGFLRHPGKPPNPKEARAAILKDWYDESAGAHQNSLAVLFDGIDFVKVGVTPEEAQFLLTRKFQIGEIARFLRVPPHLLMELDRATDNNSENTGEEFLRFSLLPLLVRIEKELTRKLFGRRRKDLEVRHVAQGLMRATYSERIAGYGVLIDRGVMTRNEARALEDMNPLPGGDEPTPAQNIVGKPAEDQAADGSDFFGGAVLPDSIQAWIRGGARTLVTPPVIEHAMVDLVVAQVETCLDRERKSIARALAKELARSVGHFETWWSAFRPSQRDYAVGAVSPVLTAWQRLGVDLDPLMLARQIADALDSRAHAVVAAAVASGEPAARLTKALESWGDAREITETVLADLIGGEK